ncbi:MAG: hypothetical protein WEA36_10745 [Balneolaceae bacterium]
MLQMIRARLIIPFTSVILVTISSPQIAYSQENPDDKIIGVGNIDSNGARMRVEPAWESEVIMEIDAGMAVIVYDYYEEPFVKVKEEGVVGYIIFRNLEENYVTELIEKEVERKEIEEIRKENPMLARVMRKYGKRDGRLVYNDKVWVGMTEEMLLDSWGEPDRKNITESIYGSSEQWIYDRGNYKSEYVYVEDGVVKTIQR